MPQGLALTAKELQNWFVQEGKVEDGIKYRK
jgi:hypothetical protein